MAVYLFKIWYVVALLSPSVIRTDETCYFESEQVTPLPIILIVLSCYLVKKKKKKRKNQNNKDTSIKMQPQNSGAADVLEGTVTLKQLYFMKFCLVWQFSL